MPWPFGGKKKRIIVRRYRALTEGGARKAFEKDANKLAKDGYRPLSSADKSHKIAFHSGDIFVTYELVE